MLFTRARTRGGRGLAKVGGGKLPPVEVEPISFLNGFTGYICLVVIIGHVK